MNYWMDYREGRRDRFIFVDENGYERDSGRLNGNDEPGLVSRIIAYEEIWLPMKGKVPAWDNKKFSDFVVHHKNGKLDNNPMDLQLLLWNDHNDVHEMMREYGGYFEFPDDVTYDELDEARLERDAEVSKCFYKMLEEDKQERDEDEAGNDLIDYSRDR